MPIEVYWYDYQEDIIILKVRDYWTWKDVEEHAEATVAEIKRVKHPVYIIMDMTEAAAMLPPEWIPNVLRQYKKAPPNWAGSVFVHRTPFLRVLQGMMNTIEYMFENYRDKHYYARTLDEAVDLISSLQDGD